MMKFPPDPPKIDEYPTSQAGSFALGWSMAWAEKRIMRCPIMELWEDDEEQGDKPCPACGATVSGKDPVNGVCQAVS
jgi:hypothetical protein